MNLIIQPVPRKKTSLHFIALIPDKIVTENIDTFKRDMSVRFGAYEALKVPTHLTLINPFKILSTEKEELLDWFSKLSLQQKFFHLYLYGFGAFLNKKHPVIYVNPVPNKELLGMQRKLMSSFNQVLPNKFDPFDLDFTPHMTVAYRDLTPENFSRAWIEYKYKPFYDVFDVHSIYLLEHDRERWNIIATHKLG